MANEIFESYLKSFKIPEEVLALYYHILKDVFKRGDTDREQEIQKFESQIESFQNRINNALDKFVDKELDRQTYDQATKRYKEKINSLEFKIKELQFQDSNFMKYTNYGLSLLGDLDRYYQQAAIEVKSKIVSSIFPENLIFEETKYRTPKVNEVLALITSNIKNLGITKKQKAAKIDSLHLMASPGGRIVYPCKW